MIFFLLLQKCVGDTLSPISIKLKFKEEQSETQAAFLNVDSVTQAVAEVRSVAKVASCK